MGFGDDARETRLKKKVEEALRSKMKAKALRECDALAAKYAECTSGRTLSVVWTCRPQFKLLNECLHQYTNDDVLEEYKKKYALEQESKN
eukprot:c33647_g1_i1 orf=81-350(+)